MSLVALSFKGRPGRAYNIGSDDAITIGALARLIRDIVAPDKEVRFMKKPEVSGRGANRYVPYISRAQNELGLTATVSLQDSIRVMDSQIT